MRRRWRWLRWIPLLAILIPIVATAWSAAQRRLRQRHYLRLRALTSAELIRDATVNPGDPAVLMVLGQRQVNAGKSEIGIHTLALAMRLAPTDPEPRLILARSVRRVLGLAQGLMVLDEFSSLYPGVPSVVAMAHTLRAEDAIDRRALDDADREVSLARAVDPDSLVARQVQAEVWRLQRRYDEAIRAAQEMIDTYPDATEAQLTRALALRSLARATEAQAAFEAVAAHRDELPFARRVELETALGGGRK